MNTLKVPLDELDYVDGTIAFTYQDRYFTGIAYETLSGTGMYTEEEYLEGIPHGITRTWSKEKVLIEEETIRYGVKSGPSRKWDEKGNLIEESTYDCGILIQKTTYDAAGNILEEFRMTPESPGYAMLELMRKSTIPPPWNE